MTKDETLRLALDTLKEVREETFRLMRNGERLYSEDKVWSTIISIQEVLAQPEQEPVAVKLMTERIITDNNGRKHITTEPLLHQSEQGNTMTKEVMQQALEVLKSKDTCGSSIREAKEDAIKALEEALETKDAPVAWMSEDEHTSKEAMTLALEALENVISYGSLTGDDFVFDQVDEATTSLRQAIADAEKQEPEPVGSVVKWIDGSLIHGWFGEPPPEGTLLYTHPQPKLETKDEPVAWGMEKDGVILDVICPAEHTREEGGYTTPLYTHPKQWVGLKDDDEIPWDGVDAKSFAKAIEAKLKEKNNG